MGNNWAHEIVPRVSLGLRERQNIQKKINDSHNDSQEGAHVSEWAMWSKPENAFFVLNIFFIVGAKLGWYMAKVQLCILKPPEWEESLMLFIEDWGWRGGDEEEFIEK